jgi:tape measure domain-containing protein
LKQVTSSQQELSGLTQRLREQALNSRTEFDLTTRTYFRLAQATKNLNINQGANLAMTETLTKAIAVSGATGAEAHATLIQLSQAMASNRLSADEFRSVSEQLPIILDLLAKSTGKLRTELKDMGEEGKLTSRVMALSLLEGLDQVRDMFDKTEVTIEQAWENIKTQTRFAVEEFNKSTGASKKVVESLQWMAQNMDTVTSAAKALGSMIGVYLITQIGLAAKAMVTLAATNPWIAAAVGLTSLIALVIQYKTEIGQVTDELGYMAGLQATPVSQWTPEMKEAFRTGKSPAKAAREMAEEAARDSKASEHTVGTEMAELDRRFAIADLRAQKDPIKDKKKGGRKGRHVPTFDEAVRDLENSTVLSYSQELANAQQTEVLRVQTQVQRQLTAAEAEYVNKLVLEKTIQEQLWDPQKKSREVAQKRYDEETKAILELKKAQEAAREEAQKIYKEQLAVENRIHRGQFDGFNSEEDVRNGRRTVKDMVLGGRLSKDKGVSALDMLEIQDPNTKTPRKEFLQEMNGIGKLADDVNGLFGPEGTLNQGLADATANAIVFGQSFKTSINALGKQIQAEIISALIKAGIRMAILGATGGGDASPTAAAALGAIGAGSAQGGYITARGKGYAAGGYTGNNGRTKIAGYVHGGEHVMKADATQRIGVGNLDYMNKTGQMPGGGGGVNVKIINNSGVRIEQQPGMTRDEVVLVAREEAAKTSGRTVAGNIRDPNSHVGKALRGNTNVRYQR